MKRIFITGATGLLGTNLTLALLQQGYEVHALVRRPEDLDFIQHRDLHLVKGGLFDPIDQHLQGIDAFIHIAAETRHNINDYQHYKRINCDATIHLVDTCIRNQVPKFIFVSTANTIGFGSLHEPGQENNPIRTPFANLMYAQSKLEAEHYLRSAKDKIHVVILNPTFMLGPYDRKPSSGKLILAGWKKKIVFYPPGGKNFVNVKDAAQAIINSLHYGKNGEQYLLANKNLSYKDFFKLLNHISNQRSIFIKLPKWLLVSLGWVGDGLRRFKIKTSLSKSNTQVLCIHNYYSNAKSLNDLKINYTPIEEGIKEAVEYFEHHYFTSK